MSKHRVKGSQRGKKKQQLPDDVSDSGFSGIPNGCRPEQKQQVPLEGFPAFSKNTCFAAPVLDIMTQIGIDAFHGEGVIFIVDVVNMLSLTFLAPFLFSLRLADGAADLLDDRQVGVVKEMHIDLCRGRGAAVA